MINTSSTYKETIKINRILHHKAEIAFADGTTVTAEDVDMFTFQVADNTSNANSFDLGSAIAQQLTLKLDNLNGTFDSHDFNEADISIKAGLEIDGVTEWLDKGKFVSEPGEDTGDTITVNAFDNMIRFDQPYSVSNLKYPATLGAIVRDACSCCNVVLAADSASFDNDNFIVTTRPDDSVTFRQILQWVGQIACKYSKINTSGQLSLRWYDTETLESTWIRQTGDSTETVCEGNSNSIDVDQSDIVQVSDLLSGSTFTTDDVVITGVRVVEESVSGNTEEDTTYQSGADGYVLTISGNKLIQDGKGATVASYLGEKLNGLRFRPLSVKCQGDPAWEAGDIGLITDRKGRNYKTILTGVTYTAYAAQSLTSGAEAPARLSATRYSTATQVYRQFREALSKQKAEWEKAYEDLQEAMNEKAGLYPVSETLDDGSKVLYFCDKPTLEESQIVVEFNAKGWGMSTDGGDTWNTGALVDGTMIAQILNTIGVNADWIRTGALVVADDEGNIIFSVDIDTKQVLISGDSVRIGGKTATAAINDVLDDSKEYADGKLADYANTVSGDLAALQAQVDGQVEDWYYDYEPSMQNYPAAEWTNNEERTKHIGDRFFWKSKGYAYRFMETDGVWGWVLLKDTDITSAMQAAQEAQDTADGKRRVFVVTPQPPYDIGDLWCNGEDILTCGVARAQGSVFVSADWQKLNNYTDDTVANEALEEAKKARNLNIILDNEYQGIPADHEGNISIFPVVQTGVQVFYGSTDVSASCSYSIAKSGSVTGSWDNTLRTYTVTGLSADTGWVDITASYLGLFSATKRFNVQKVRDGAKGEDGIPGEAGKGIKSTTVTYQASSSGITVPTGTWSTEIPSVSANQYLWTRTVIIYTDNTTSTSYSIGKMGATGAKGDKGDKGDTGATGEKGDKGDKGDTGATGKGIKSVVNYYLASASASGVTTSTSGWTTTIQTISTSKKYLWNYEKITYTDNTISSTTPCIIGVYGNTGATGATGAAGKGISSITEYYLASASASGVTTSTSGWTTTMQTTTTTKKYLWNYEKITYTDGTTSNTTVRIIGTHGATGATGAKGDKGDTGATGAAGKGVKSTAVTYQASSSGTTIPTGTWSTAIPSVSAGSYLWTRTVITYTDNTTSVSYSVGKMGNTGTAARTYFIEPSVNVLKRGQDNAVYPNTLGFSAYYRDGNSTTRTAYSGRFVIEKTTDGKTWTEIYRSSQNESSVTHTLTGISKDVVQIRAKLYAAGGATTLMDIQSVAVVTDVDALTPLEVLELASQGMEGIYSPDGVHFYFSASAIKSGIMQGIEILSKSDNDWMRMYQSLLTGGYGSTTDGLLDLSANYADGRHVVLESKTGDVILKSKNEIKVERQSGTMGYLVQSGTPGLVEGDTIIIENDVQPVVLIGWDEDSDAMYLRLKNETSKYLYPQSSVGGYVLAGYQIITLDTGGQAVSPNGTSATDSVTISANLRDASYSYTYQLIETGWLTPASVTWSGNPYYQLSCKFLNTGSYSHSGSAKFIVYAWKNR